MDNRLATLLTRGASLTRAEYRVLAHLTEHPLLVGNIGPATFGQDDNALLLVDARGPRELPRASKRVLAQLLVQDIATRLPPAVAV